MLPVVVAGCKERKRLSVKAGDKIRFCEMNGQIEFCTKGVFEDKFYADQEIGYRGGVVGDYAELHVL